MTTSPGRQVRVFSSKRSAYGVVQKVEVGQGWLHQFGTDYEEFESGAVPYSIAIVELADGTVIMPRADLIQFI